MLIQPPFSLKYLTYLSIHSICYHLLAYSPAPLILSVIKFLGRPRPTKRKTSYRCSSVLGNYRHLHSSNHSTRTLVTDKNEERARKDTLRCACCTRKPSCLLESLLPVISLLPPLVCLKRSPSTRTLGQRTSEKKKSERKQTNEKACLLYPCSV